MPTLTANIKREDSLLQCFCFICTCYSRIICLVDMNERWKENEREMAISKGFLGHDQIRLTWRETTIVLECVWMWRPFCPLRERTKPCSCDICLFKLLMSWNRERQYWDRFIVLKPLRPVLKKKTNANCASIQTLRNSACFLMHCKSMCLQIGLHI